jgi:hypothetical protein
LLENDCEEKDSPKFRLIREKLNRIGFGSNAIQFARCTIHFESAGDSSRIKGYNIQIEEFQGEKVLFNPWDYRFIFVGYCTQSSRFYIAMTHYNLKRAEGTFFANISDFDAALTETISKVNASYQNWIAEA